MFAEQTVLKARPSKTNNYNRNLKWKHAQEVIL